MRMPYSYGPRLRDACGEECAPIDDASLHEIIRDLSLLRYSHLEKSLLYERESHSAFQNASQPTKSGGCLTS